MSPRLSGHPFGLSVSAIHFSQDALRLGKLPRPLGFLPGRLSRLHVVRHLLKPQGTQIQYLRKGQRNFRKGLSVDIQIGEQLHSDRGRGDAPIKLELFTPKDFINLNFCCQQATVITDFSDLAAVGRDHYMNLHGGSAPIDELNALDGEKVARQLIESGGGTVTPYGVVYDNGMKLEQVYRGKEFPCYYYEPNPITIALTPKTEPEDTEQITWLFLPMEQEEIDRAIQRAGIADLDEVCLRLEDSQLPNEVDVLLKMEQENLSDLNALAQAANGMPNDDLNKLGAVVALAKPQTAVQIKKLVKNLDLFDFAPGTHTPEEYGKYMIQQSGHFEYDENPDDFYDYAKYGIERINEENGIFTDRGYIAYNGDISIEEVMEGGQTDCMGFQMGGIS